MKYVLVATAVVVLTVAMGSAYAQTMGCTKGDIAAQCARESGLCGLATRALTKGTVLLGYTRDKGDCPTNVHVHVFGLSQMPDKRARVKAFMYAPNDPAHGMDLKLMRHGRGEYKAPIKWDTTKPMELAVKVHRRGMNDETVYFKLEPGIAPETK